MNRLTFYPPWCAVKPPQWKVSYPFRGWALPVGTLAEDPSHRLLGKDDDKIGGITSVKSDPVEWCATPETHVTGKPGHRHLHIVYCIHFNIEQVFLALDMLVVACYGGRRAGSFLSQVVCDHSAQNVLKLKFNKQKCDNLKCPNVKVFAKLLEKEKNESSKNLFYCDPPPARNLNLLTKCIWLISRLF